MAHGVYNINDSVLFASAQTKLPGQLDYTMFTDCMGDTAISAQSTSEGTGVQGTALNAGSIGSQLTSSFGGMTASANAMTFSTSGSNNATAYCLMRTPQYLLPGLPIPAAGFITKYEFEALIATTANIHTNVTADGAFYLGFQQALTYPPVSGVGFRFSTGTLNDTNWMITWANGLASTYEAVSTGVAVTANTEYRMYLCVEVNSAGTYTTTYNIKNRTTGVSTVGVATPTGGSAAYPGEGFATHGFGASILNTRNNVTATTVAVVLNIDYMGIRIRRPLTREILIGK